MLCNFCDVMATISQNILIFVSKTSQLISLSLIGHIWSFRRNWHSIKCCIFNVFQYITTKLDLYQHNSALIEPWHDKTNKMTVRPAKTQISLDIRPVWSESLLSAWRKLGSLATHWVHSKDSYQTVRMSRLIWVFAGRTVTLLVLSCHGSIGQTPFPNQWMKNLPCYKHLNLTFKNIIVSKFKP